MDVPFVSGACFFLHIIRLTGMEYTAVVIRETFILFVGVDMQVIPLSFNYFIQSWTHARSTIFVSSVVRSNTFPGKYCKSLQPKEQQSRCIVEY